ncbi:Lrp/AsnC family transcriptional regulator [Novosphingobium sp. RD2P27]|uniref:Lrp/AsnC family transcriptional regulator n=1 Tax=Novosphingobium kalidii TaxID=3230299 RepID=A0ABV2D1G4_9SPHN
MDRIDWAVLAALEADGRLGYAALGEIVGLSKTPCWTRVQRLEERGVITGYRADIDRSAVGLPLTAFCEVTVDFAHHHDFEAAIKSHPAVLECYTTAGQGDYLLKIVCGDVEHLDTILREQISGIPGVVRSSSTIALKSIKQANGIMPFASQSRQG